MKAGVGIGFGPGTWWTSSTSTDSTIGYIIRSTGYSAAKVSVTVAMKTDIYNVICVRTTTR